MDPAARRARLSEDLRQAGIDALYVTSMPNVRYLSGFSGSHGHLLVGWEGATLLTDGRYVAQAEREAPGVERVGYRTDPSGAIAGAARRLGASAIGFEADVLTFGAHAALVEEGLEMVPTRGLVESLREIKDVREIDSIQAAQDAADHAFGVVVTKLTEGMTERDVAFELEAAMRQAGSHGPAFDTIVAFGPSSAEPHHAPTDRPLGRGDVVKCDFGSTVGGYRSDMTRTVVFGKPSARAREVYEVVLRAQLAGVEAVRAGARAADIDAAARSVVADAGFRDAFSHPLGHGVGLEIHEAPWLRAGDGETLPVAAVITVEPGIYLDGEFGVRIEDMVEVTADGPRVMASSPKELIVL
jgi:Xaa-Pro aminopeptidase